MGISTGNQRYKDRILTAPYEICIERARYVTQSYRQTEGQHAALRAAKAFAHVCRNMTITIDADEQILGNRSSKPVGTLLPIERGEINAVLELELDALTTRQRQPYRIDPDDKRELLEDILPYWKGRTLRDQKNRLWKQNGLFFRPGVSPASLYTRAKSLDLARLRRYTAVPDAGPRYAFRGLREILYNNIALILSVFDTQGHLVLGHKNVLKEGFIGIGQRAKTGLHAARARRDAQAAAFYEGVLISCDAIREFAGRVAFEAERLAEVHAAPERVGQLREMALRCRRVPYHPPRDFREALQALWLTQVGGLLSYGQSAIFAVGRVDQYLFPFYKADIDSGRLSEHAARELLEEMLLKLGSNLMIIPFLGKYTGNELGSDSCTPTIGGLTPDGNDAVNELTYRWLEAYENVRSTGNSFMIRLSKHNPPDYVARVFDTFRKTSGAGLFNDEVVSEALMNCGMAPDHARDFGLIGCVEPTGDGDTFACTSGNDISLAAAVEMCMTGGAIRLMGRRLGPRTADPTTMTCFEDVMGAYKQHVRWMIATVVKAVNLKDQAYRDYLPNPFVSSTIKGCIESGRDMTAGGARYNFASISARGLGTAVDSLAAIKHFVFDTQTLSMRKLVRMLDTNFKGEQVWQQRLKNKAPVYGADMPEADAIAKDIVAFFCDEVSRHPTIRGGMYRPSFFSYGMHVFEGMLLGATPNGRKAGEPISNSMSPTNGAERNGPTALFNSVATSNHSRITNGCALNVKFLPAFFETDERRDKMIALVKGYFSKGGMEVQPNVVSNETLLAAQRDPDQYRDLVVRVSGYSAYFCDLGKPLQDEIISRQEMRGPR